MKMPLRFALAAMAGAVTMAGLAAAPAAARTTVSIEYRDRDYRDVRHDRHDRYDRHDRRDWHRHHHDRWDRWDRWDRRSYQRWQRNSRVHCWTELRYDRRYHERYRVRFCR